MTYLLDTNVLSELVKSRKNSGVLNWLAATETAHHRVSVMSIGEMRRGVQRLILRRDLDQARRLGTWLEATIDIYRDRIVPVDTAIAECWGLRAAGVPLPTVDGLIAATAEVKGWTVVTRNVKAFARLEVETLNPFTEEDR